MRRIKEKMPRNQRKKQKKMEKKLKKERLRVKNANLVKPTLDAVKVFSALKLFRKKRQKRQLRKQRRKKVKLNLKRR